MSTIGYINVSMEIFGGLLSLVFILCLQIIRHKRERMEQLYIRMLACNTALLFSDATAILFKGRLDPFSFCAVRVSNFLVFTLGYVILFFFTQYLVGFLEEKGITVPKTPIYVMCCIMLAAIGLSVLSQFNGMYYIIDGQNRYQRQNFFWLSQAFGVLGLMVNGSLLLRYRKKMKVRELIGFGIYICLPFIALLIQILFYGIAVLYLATTLCLLYVYLSIQTEAYRKASQRELELEKSRTAVMISQIQPHFLYNSLMEIKFLCDTEPSRASEALEHFSFYLRGNLDALTDQRLIPFEKELVHIRDYLYLEKLRFSKKLNIVWEIEARNFLLPPLAVQPLIENAIRHGIVTKKGGGTLTIRSERTPREVIVTICDDGVGFDPTEQKNDGRSHVGIENTKSRLEILCGGTLEIKSEPGTGTQAKIILPQKGGQDEDHCGG